MKVILFIIVGLISLVSNSQVTSNPNIIEILGQSNARGEASTSTLPSDLAGPQMGEYIYNTASGTWQLLQAGVNNQGTATGYPQTAAFGVEMRLMKLLYTHFSQPQYVIKYDLGGTGLAQQTTGQGGLDWSPSSTNELYAQSNTNHFNALSAINETKAPRAVIWIQGEQDAAYSDQATAYQTNLQSFIAAKRAAYNNANLPFIIVRLGDQQNISTYPYLNTVRTAQTTVASQPNNYLVSADGLVTSDGSHYTAAGYDSIANRIYRQLNAIEASEAFIVRGHHIKY